MHFTLSHRWADSDIFIMNMSVKLEDIIDQWGNDDEVQIIITRDCLTINGTSCAYARQDRTELMRQP